MSIDPAQIELPDDALVAILRTKTPAQRLAMAFDCNRTARLVIAGHLRTRHPDWTEMQIQAEISRRMLLGSG